MSSNTIHANLFMKASLEIYHKDIKYHMTLNAIFNVLFWEKISHTI